jgi:ferredoxin-type protein NapG
MPNDRTVNRRGFFREGLRELLRPIAELADPLQEAAEQLRQAAHAAPGSIGRPRRVALQVWLRPPGALPERDFLDTCSRCGDCVKVCPAQCIRIDSGTAGGAPHIIVESMPCVVCDTLACMHACPTGALSPIPLHEIDMGTAMWNERSCVRTDGEECTTCIDQCPLGSAAIELREDRIHVIEQGCIGCGVCEYHCPTRPRSIIVSPRVNHDFRPRP